MLTKQDLITLLDVTHGCTQVENDEDISRLLNSLQKLIPFESAVMCSASVENKKVKSINNFLNYGYDEKWLLFYEKNNYIKIDPVMLHAPVSSDPFNWTQAFKLHGGGSREFMEASNDFHLKNGLSCTGGIPQVDVNTTILSLSMGNQKVSNHYCYILYHILPHLHGAYNRIVKDPKLPLPFLSMREKEILKWIMEGKTSWEVGVILSLAERTIKFHLKNIFVKLNVVNRAQAIAKAMQIGLLE